jgi:hypothetical protein
MYMTLEQIKNGLKQICLGHRYIQSFGFGESFYIDENPDGSVNTAYLEIPYGINYRVSETYRKPHLLLTRAYPIEEVRALHGYANLGSSALPIHRRSNEIEFMITDARNKNIACLKNLTKWSRSFCSGCNALSLSYL